MAAKSIEELRTSQQKMSEELSSRIDGFNSRIEEMHVHVDTSIEKVENQVLKFADEMTSLKQLIKQLIDKDNKKSEFTMGTSSAALGDGLLPTPPRHESPEVNLRYDNQCKIPKIDFPLFNGDAPMEWIRRSERYFQIHEIPESHKVGYAELFLRGVADVWFGGLRASFPNLSWQKMREEILKRFGCKSMDMAVDEFHQLKQAGYVDEYLAEPILTDSNSFPGIQLMKKAEELLPSKIEVVKVAYRMFDEIPKPISIKTECLSTGHHLFDEMPILFSVKENDKSKGCEKLGLQVAEMSRVLSFKEDANETSKFVFDPGGSSWLHNGCDSFGFTDDKKHFDKFSANYSQNELGKGWQESWPKIANELGLLPLMLKLAAQVQRPISCPLVNTGFKMLLKVVLELHSQQNGLFPKPKLNKRQVVFQIHGFGKIGILSDLLIQKEPAHIDYNDNNLLLMKKGHVFEYSNRDGHEFGLVRFFPMDNLLFVQSSTQRKIAGDGSIQNLSAEPDNEVAIVVMDFLISFKIGTETKFDPARWLENYLFYIRLFNDAIQIDTGLDLTRGRATYPLSKTFNVANLIHFPQSAIRVIPVVLHIDNHKLIWNALKQLAAKILFSLVTFWAFGCLHLADAVNANVLNVELWLELYKAFQIEIQAAFCTVTSWIAVIAMVTLDAIMAVVPHVMEIEDCSLVINVENFI